MIFLNKFSTHIRHSGVMFLISLILALQTRSPFMFEFYIESFFVRYDLYSPQNFNIILIVVLILSPLLFLFPVLEKKFTIKFLLASSSFVTCILYLLLNFITSKIYIYVTYFCILFLNFCVILPTFMKLTYLWVDKHRLGIVSGILESIRIIFGYIFSRISLEFFSGSIIFYCSAFFIAGIFCCILVPNEHSDVCHDEPSHPMDVSKKIDYSITTVVVCVLSFFAVGLIYCLSMFNSNIEVFFYVGHNLSSTLERFSSYIIPVIASIFAGLFWDTAISKQWLLLTLIATTTVLTAIQLCLPIQSSLLPIVLIVYSLSCISVYSLRVVLPLVTFTHDFGSKKISSIICYQLICIGASSVLIPMFLFFINQKFSEETAYLLTYQLMMIFAIISYICINLSRRLKDIIKSKHSNLSEPSGNSCHKRSFKARMHTNKR